MNDNNNLNEDRNLNDNDGYDINNDPGQTPQQPDKIYMNIHEEQANETSNEETFREPDQFDFSRPSGKATFYRETIKQKKGTSLKKIIAVCLIVSLVGGGSIGAGFAVTQHLFKDKTVASNPFSSDTTSSGNGNYIQTSSSQKSTDSNTSIQIIKNTTPAVVSITTKESGTRTSVFSGFSVPYEASGAGSGVIFHEDDTKVYIATNNHVIDGATQIGISVPGENGSDDIISASTVGTDSTSDLAVISVLKSDLTAAKADYKIATFGDSENLEVGESVIAIGNALGEGKTATGGMISALGKVINIDGKKLQVIQTDAAINPGNSGGALVNYNGEVIGINTAKSYDSSSASVEGMGYAMPSNVIIPIIEKLLTEGSIPKPYLGIVGADITEEMAQLYGGLPMGVLVRDVVEGGSAANAGIQSGDIITSFAGEQIMTMDNLVTALGKQKVGAVVDIKIIRDGSTPLTLKATIQDANQE